MSDIDGVTGEVIDREEDDRVFTRADMRKPGALQTMRDRGIVSGTAVTMSNTVGGLRFENMMQVMEFAKIMATADMGVPAYLRGNPGACLAITMRAQAWGFEPFFVAEQSYAVKTKDGDYKIAFMSQLVHAVVERRAPMDGRLRAHWEGSMDDGTRRCVVTGNLIGEKEPFIWRGPMIKDIKVKNSPEWSANPDKQLFYHATRDWARMNVPDVLGGVYTRDELLGAELGPNAREDVKAIASRLPEKPEGGFSADGIAKTLGEATGGARPETAQKEPAAEQGPSEPAKAAKPRSRKAAKEQTTAAQEEPATEEATASEDAQVGEEPTDEPSYIAYFENWLPLAKNRDMAETRWESERELRAKCKMTVQARKKLERMLDEKFGET